MENYQLALIGDPVTQSKSPLYHNYFLKKLGRKERYGKFEVTASQLNHFLKEAKKQNMIGLSVTMPLKEIIIPLLDEVDKNATQIGAVNTVKFLAGKVLGFNTDGLGVRKAMLHCYEQPLIHKKVLIIGAGGVAKAIAWDLSNIGMVIMIANRTYEEAKFLANAIEAKVCPFEEIGKVIEDCDFLINATSVGMLNQEQIINPTLIPRNCAIVDLISAPQNEWLLQLSQKGCLTISGRLIWLFQALEQYKIWFADQLDLSCAFTLMQEALGHNFTE